MRYPPKAYKKDLETAEVRGGRSSVSDGGEEEGYIQDGSLILPFFRSSEKRSKLLLSWQRRWQMMMMKSSDWRNVHNATLCNNPNRRY